MSTFAVPDQASSAHVERDLERLVALVGDAPGRWKEAVPGAGPLAEALYLAWYTTPPPIAVAPDDPPAPQQDLTGALRAARSFAALGDAPMDAPGPSVGIAPVDRAPWVVLAAHPDGTLMVQRGTTVRRIRIGDYAARTRPGVPPAPGEPVDVLAPPDLLDADRGLWWSFSDPPPEPPFGRVYLDVRAATAPRAVAVLVTALSGLPHQFKVPVLRDAYTRVDALVLYHALDNRSAVLDALVQAPFDHLLDHAVPPLTCSFGPGLAWADDPGEEASFGEHRCRALAAGIEADVESWARADAGARVRILLDALAIAGVDPARPWIGAP